MKNRTNQQKQVKISQIKIKPCVNCGFPLEHFYTSEQDRELKVFTQVCPNCSKLDPLD